MELLDELCLPKKRISNVLVGIWVLNKGKLAPPPNPPVAPTVPAAVLALPATPSGQASVPLSAVPPAAITPLHIAPEVLAAEMASLTPQQIQLMLRTLSATNALPPPPVSQQSHMPPHHSLSASPPQSWQPNMIGYPGTYGSPHVPQPHPQASYAQVPQNRYDQGRGSYDRGDRGGRGWNGDTRGRGRGRGYDDQRKPLDSGWGGSRNRGSWDGPSGGRRGWS
jgi:hypothetical protein